MTSSKFRAKLTSTATRQIVEQADYYRDKSGAALATRWQIAVKNAVASLRTMSERGEPCSFVDAVLHDVRRIEVSEFERFSLYYRVDSSNRTVLILMILHEARQVEALLGKQQRIPER